MFRFRLEIIALVLCLTILPNLSDGHSDEQEHIGKLTTWVHQHAGYLPNNIFPGTGEPRLIHITDYNIGGTVVRRGGKTYTERMTYNYPPHSHVKESGGNNSPPATTIVSNPNPVPQRQVNPDPDPQPVVSTGGSTGDNTGDPVVNEQQFSRAIQNAVVSVPVSKPKPVMSVSQRLLVTEYMLLDNGRKEPHWIEVYNPNTVAVDLAGYTFTHGEWHSRNKYSHHKQTLMKFEIPAKSAIILASHDITKHIGDHIGGLDKKQIYQLNLNQYILKSGWLFQDPQGNDIHRVGRAFDLGGPVIPPHAGKWIRQSHHRYPSADAPSKTYYGEPHDVGTPGFFEHAPAAPALIRPKRFGIWADLKK
ncbi:MAG: hypothetical protein OXD49_08900 [Candidatus Poribacteria bacterium]|nr:hypothetical protein [Candidatus Poribacteria bacterium]